MGIADARCYEVYREEYFGKIKEAVYSADRVVKSVYAYLRLHRADTRHARLIKFSYICFGRADNSRRGFAFDKQILILALEYVGYPAHCIAKINRYRA